MLIVARRCPVATPNPAKFQKRSHNRILRSERPGDARIIPGAMWENSTALDVGIQDQFGQENYDLLSDLATGVRILVLRYPLVAHLMTTERPSRTASLLDPGRIPRELPYSSREQAFKFLISPSNIAAVGRFLHTWSDSCRILLISSSLLWRIEAE